KIHDKDDVVISIPSLCSLSPVFKSGILLNICASRELLPDFICACASLNGFKYVTRNNSRASADGAGTSAFRPQFILTNVLCGFTLVIYLAVQLIIKISFSFAYVKHSINAAFSLTVKPSKTIVICI